MKHHATLQVDLEAPLAAAVRAILPELVAALTNAIRKALDDRLIDIAEAAELMGDSEAALRKRIARGDLKVVRVGRRVKVRLADIATA